MTVALAVEDVEFLADLARELMGDEPLPDISTRTPHRLEGVLDAPFSSFGGEEKYPGLFDKAAVLFYHACKDHPFQNGNKRMAVMMAIVFLYLNGYWLDVPPISLYNTAVDVTASDKADREETLAALKGALESGADRRTDLPA